MKSELKLTDREWKEFRLGGEWFKISGTTTTHPSILVAGGQTPRITCAATNNGFENCYANSPTEKGRTLTVDSATIGYIAYQEADFIATDHVEKIGLKHRDLDKYIGLFLLTCINKSILGKYGYGYKFSQKRIKTQIVLLPVTSDGTPDWEFMSAFMKRVEQETLLPALRHFKSKKCNKMLMGGGGVK